MFKKLFCKHNYYLGKIIFKKGILYKQCKNCGKMKKIMIVNIVNGIKEKGE